MSLLLVERLAAVTTAAAICAALVVSTVSAAPPSNLRALLLRDAATCRTLAPARSGTADCSLAPDTVTLFKRNYPRQYAKLKKLFSFAEETLFPLCGRLRSRAVAADGKFTGASFQVKAGEVDLQCTWGGTANLKPPFRASVFVYLPLAGKSLPPLDPSYCNPDCHSRPGVVSDPYSWDDILGRADTWVWTGRGHVEVSRFAKTQQAASAARVRDLATFRGLVSVLGLPAS